jgi:hypothetical protein
LTAYLDLITGEHSCGDNVRPRGISKKRNADDRRVMSELDTATITR